MDITTLKTTLESDPLNTDALEKLQAALIDAEDLEGLRELHENLYDAYSDEADLDSFLRQTELKARTSDHVEISPFLYARLGMLYWQRMENPDKAELYFRRITDKCPEFKEEHHIFYVDFYSNRGNWRRLEKFMMEAAGEPEEPDEVIQIKRNLARRATAAGMPDKAITFWSSVLELDPADLQAEDTLLRLYQEVKKWHSLVDLLQRRAKRLPEEQIEERLALYGKMIEIYRDHIKSDTKVNSTYQAILEVDPGNEDALNALSEQYEKMKRWPDLVRILQKKIAVTTHRKKLIKLHREVATIMMERFSNSAEALKSYNAILELDDTNKEAIEQLKDIYEKRRDYESYLDVARKEVALIQDETEQQTKILELARFASDKIRKPSSAIALWEDVLAIKPEHPEGLEKLELLFEREKNYDELVMILERRLQIVEENETRVPMLEKLGLVLASRLQDEERAAGVWLRLLEEAPDHRKAQNEIRKRALAAKDWDRIEWLYRQYGTIGELVRTLDTQIKNLATAEEKVHLLFKVAALWQTEMDQPLRAIKSLEHVLELDPHNHKAAKELVPLYEKEQRWAKLAGVQEILLQVATDGEVRQALLLTLAKLYEDRLSDTDQAFFTFVQVYKEDIESRVTRDELERLAERSGNWDTYVAVLQESIPRIQRSATRIQTELRCAQIFRDRLQDNDQALQHYRAVLDQDGENSTALDAIESIYEDTEQWRALIGILTQKRALAENSADERTLLFRIGGIWRDRLGDNDEAGSVFRELLAQFPNDPRIHRELSAIYLMQEDYGRLLGILEEELNLLLAREETQTEEIAAVHTQIAQLTYATSNDLETVLLHYAAALETDPGYHAALNGLEELLGSDEMREQVVEMLAPIYAAAENWNSLADAWEIQIQYMTRRKDRIRCLEKLGRLCRDSLDDDQRAFRAYGRIFGERPTHEKSRSALEELAGGLGAWNALVELYESKVDDIEDEELRRKVRETIANTTLYQLEDMGRAQRHYEALLGEDPQHAQSLQCLEHIYAQTEQWEPLLGIYHTRRGLASDVDGQIEQLAKMEQIWSGRLHRVDEAIATVQEILSLDESRIDAYERLDALFTQAERWEDLPDTLSRLTELHEDVSVRTGYRIRLAEVKEHRLEDIVGAIRVHAQIQEEDPGNSTTIAALERLFDSGIHSDRIAPLLEPTYRSQNNWQRLVAVYRVQKEASKNNKKRIDLDFQIARLYEEEGQDAQTAFSHYGSAYEINPAYTDALEQILRLTDNLGNHEATIALLSAHVDRIEDTDHRCRIHRVIAEMAQQKLGDRQTAKAHHRAILSLTPESLNAIDALLGLHREGNEWADLCDTLQLKARFVTESHQRSELLKEAADIANSQLDSPEHAIGIYEEVLDLNPDDDAVLTALEALYTRVEDWANLVQVVTNQMVRAEETQTRKDLARRRATLFEEKLESLEEAVECHRIILEWDADDMGALENLDRLYSRLGQFFELSEILHRIQAHVEEGEKRELQFRLGQLWENQLEDVSQAIETYATLLQWEPNHERAIAALEAIVTQRDEREQAFEVLAPILEEQEQMQRLYDLNEVLAGHRDDPSGRIALLHRMAQIAELNLSNPTRAFACYGQAFQEDLLEEASVHQLERLAEAHSLWEDLQSLYSQGAGEAADPTRALSLQLEVGNILRHRIGDVERAIACYEALREDHPEHPIVLDALDDLYQSVGSWSSLAEVLQTQIESATEIPEKIRLGFRLADIQETRLDNANGGFDSYQEILYLSPGHANAIDAIWRLCQAGVRRSEASEILEPVYMDQQRWDDQRALLELRLEDMSDPMDQGDLMRQIAELHLNRLDDASGALRWFGTALSIDPDDDYLVTQLEDMGTRTGDARGVVDALLRAADNSDDDRRVEIWHKAVRQCLDPLNDLSNAEDLYRKILTIHEDDNTALSGLDTLFSQGERWQELEQILSRRIDVAEYEDEQVKLLQRLGTHYRDRLDQPEEAIGAFRKILDLDENNLSALRTLASLYETHQRWEPLIDVYDQLTNGVSDEAERCDLFERMARIVETELHRPADAIGLWEEVLMIRPENRSALHEMQRLLESAGKWDSLAESLEQNLRLLREEEAEEKYALHLRLGRLWRDTLDDSLQSQHHWEQVLHGDSTNLEAATSLRSVYRDSGAVEALAGILERLLASDNEAAGEKLPMWIELADLRQTVLGQPHGAIDAWEQVLAVKSNHEDGLDSLEQLYSEHGQWEDAIGVIRRRMALREEQGRAEDVTEMLLHIAEIYARRLQDSAASARAYEELLARDPANIDASYQLESLYEETQNWTPLVEVFLGRVQHLEDPADVITTLHKLGRLYEDKIQDPGSAFLVHQRILSEDPDETQSLVESERLANLTGDWEGLAQSWKTTVPRMEDELQKVDYLMRLGGIVRDRLDRPEASMSHFRGVLECQPDHVPALQALVELSTLIEDWPALIETLEQLVDASPDYREQTRIAARIGDVYEKHIGNQEAAILAYKKTLELDENDNHALRALERLHRIREDWTALIEVLELLMNAHPDEEVSHRLEIGRVHIHQRNDMAAAVEAFEEILNLDPAHPDALNELESLYREKEDWDGLVAVYERLLQNSADPESRVTLCRNIAMIQEEIFEDPHKAAEYYQQGLDILPSDTRCIENLKRILSVNESWDELIHVLEQHAQFSEDPVEQVSLLEQIAETYQDKMEDLDSAIQAFERVLQVDAKHSRTLAALENLYRENEYWEQVLQILDRKISLVGEEGRTALRCEKAQIYTEKLFSPSDAIRELETALNEDPNSFEVVRTLQAAHASCEDWNRLIESLVLEQTLHSEPEKKADTYVRIAKVYTEQIGDEANAIAYYEMALQELPTYAPAAVALSSVYVEQERWEAAAPLLNVISAQLATIEDPEQAADLHFLLAQCKENLMEFDEALAAYEQARTLRPTHKDTLRGLARLSLQRQRFQDAEAHYLALVDLIQTDASEGEMVECYMALGEIALSQGSDESASEYLEKALSMDPDNPDAISNLVQMAREHKNWNAVVRYQQELIPLKYNPIEQLAMQIEVGDIYKDFLGNLDAASDAYLKALDLDPSSKAVLGKMLPISVEKRNFTQAVEILEQLIEAEEDTLTRANHSFMLAILYRDELHDDEQAVYYFNQTLDLDPSRLEAFQTLDAMLTAKQAWKEEERAYRKMIERIAGSGNTKLEFNLYKSLGEIYRTRLKDFEYAIPAFQLALERNPNDVKVQEILAELYAASPEHEEKLISTHRRLIEIEPDKRIESYQFLYNMFLDKGNIDGAWCLAGVLRGIGKADEDTRNFYSTHRTPSMAKASKALSGQAWQEGVIFEKNDLVVGQIFQILYEALGSELRSKSIKEVGIKNREPLSLDDGSVFANVFNTVTFALDIEPPEVYLSEDHLGLTVENLNPPAIIIGPDMLSGKSEKELAFLIGKCLCYFLPAHLMAGMYDRKDLKTLFLAAMKVTTPALDVGDDEVILDITSEIQRNLPAERKEKLSKLIHDAQTEKQVDLSEWGTHVEMSANHTGLLMANDFEVALNTLRSGAFTMSKLQVKDAAKDLVSYMVSDRYLALRQHLGIALSASDNAKQDVPPTPVP